MTLSTQILEYTQSLSERGLLRQRLVSTQDKDLIRFDCNDYLSLLNDKRIAQAYEHGFRSYPSGSGGSIVLSGYHLMHQTLESAFAEFLGVDGCIVFSSGYAANLAVTGLLSVINAHCILDKEVHASIYDGLVLNKLNYTRFVHNDVENLAKKLEINSNNSVIVTEGIFSMSGQKAPLSSIKAIVAETQTPIIVDEAHSIGVLGKEGIGAVGFHQLSQVDVPLRIIPLGKAFAGQGAVVAGQERWIKALLQAGRSAIYSTAISPALCYGLLKTLDVVRIEEQRRTQLKHLIHFFQQQIAHSPLTFSYSDTAIQQLQLGCPHRALHFAKELKQVGFCCSAIRAPTVSTKYAGLRFVLNYKHTQEQISLLFERLNNLYETQPH